MFIPTARILADSTTEAGDRLTTLEVTGHRFILAELNTHRVFSRNSASSRAIPYTKMRQKIVDSLAYPVSWPSEQKGMQGGEELEKYERNRVEIEWWNAAQSAILHADKLHELNLHKSVINRLLEPFIPHTAILSATDWQGFWEQRCHPDAQPEIRVLAEAMKAAYDESNPFVLRQDEWHLPLIYPEDWQLIAEECPYDETLEVAKEVSVARCARVSYETHEGKRDISADLELYNRLRYHKPAHASPFEHVATPWTYDREYRGQYKGNFTGWVQLRHIEGLG